MTTTPTFPGVYISEIPSGVRTITGVGTSITAFIGAAKRGPLNKAVRITSFADYERRFGGLASDSEMSYAVRQFYSNGGGVAFIVRIAKNPATAERNLTNNGANVLRVVAVDEGADGNNIRLAVSHGARIAGSNFNLTISYQQPEATAPDRVEEFPNLSMNSQDARWAEDVVNGISDLVTVERTVNDATLNGLAPATSRSGPLEDPGGALLDVDDLIDPTHNQFRIVVNGLDPVDITLPTSFTGAGTADRLASLCQEVEDQVSAGGPAALTAFTCAPDGTQILMTSGEGGEESSIRVLPGIGNDASALLRLGSQNGGIEVDGVAAIRPDEAPEPGSLTGTAITTLPAATPTNHRNLAVGLDGKTPMEVSIGNTDLIGGTLTERIADAAERIQAAVRAANPASTAFRAFTATVDTTPAVVLRSGSRGPGSAVTVTAGSSADLAAELGLLAGATSTAGQATTLQGGNEEPFDPTSAADIVPLVLASRTDRDGIYALEDVDLFNLLCIPGVSDPTVLADAIAYCEERRAFMIVDPPGDVDDPTEMEVLINGTSLPKSNYGAVYWPWLEIGDPLKPGQSREVAPSGTVAGVYARTDSRRGVWKAPAGIEASMNGVRALGYLLTDLENGVLNPLGVNSARIFPGTGAVVWGARTLRGDDDLADEYKYVPVRRVALMIEESLYRGTQWAVFEPNDERLWSQLRLNIGAYMHGLFRQGAFQGASPRDAYFVKIDSETTTQNDINRGIVNIIVGFAPLKPAEFVMIQIQQMAGQIQT